MEKSNSWCIPCHKPRFFEISRVTTQVVLQIWCFNGTLKTSTAGSWILSISISWEDTEAYDHWSMVADRWTHRCPFPIGWLINRGVCLPLWQQVNDGRWYTKPTPLFLPKGHDWLNIYLDVFDRDFTVFSVEFSVEWLMGIQPKGAWILITQIPWFSSLNNLGFNLYKNLQQDSIGNFKTPSNPSWIPVGGCEIKSSRYSGWLRNPAPPKGWLKPY